MSVRPVEATQVQDGSFEVNGARVCEDCWTPIPRYVDFPRGLVSPESDGDKGGNFAKRREVAVGDKMGYEALQKVVCRECYLAAYGRVYPHAPLPKPCADILPPKQTAPVEVVVEAAFVPQPEV